MMPILKISMVEDVAEGGGKVTAGADIRITKKMMDIQIRAKVVDVVEARVTMVMGMEEVELEAEEVMEVADRLAAVPGAVAIKRKWDSYALVTNPFSAYEVFKL